ncbi:MAG: FAD-dependent pyridine nucleotide-disulfide oxidoreductase [Fusobacteriales bacterium]|jgi:hypothetical protein|nr:FAD-dependent pyridine nucleotide-disulfide oxidoreductase [Fusobacteriales bacterium]
MKIKVQNIKIPVNIDQEKGIYEYLKKNGIEKKYINKIEYKKRSIDSRNKNNIFLLYNIEVELNKKINTKFEEVKEKTLKQIKSKNIEGTIAIIGTGPAGLFAAYRLCELGYKPIIFERGKKVEERDKDIENFITTNVLNPNSNIQFGEGGAGTYSDGKLTTRVKSIYKDEIFNTLVECGAQKEILFDYKPHIGTDVLKIVVTNLRKKIESMGGKFYFNSTLTDIKIKNEVISQIEINKNELIDIDYLFLAIGHSSRDTYYMLHKNNVFLENKDFAIGARIESPRYDIDLMQHGKFYNSKILGSATYNFTYNNQNEKRGVFSFCMCPGGEIVNAASEENTSLVNGMSYSQRDGKFSNSAIVVAIRENDYGNKLFDGMKLQEKLEKQTYEIISTYGALYQSVNDFLKNTKTKQDIESSYKMNLYSYNLNNFFPEVISRNMRNALNYWDKKMPLFTKNANLIAPETRTSAPIRITRDETGKSINVNNLFPIGEGAGYAGGIISAAIDGMKIVDMNFGEIIG